MVPFCQILERQWYPGETDIAINYQSFKTG
jgi:hypothetical protein